MRKTLFALLATALLCSMFVLASLRAETIRFGLIGQVSITPPAGWQVESRKDGFGLGNHTVTLIADKSRKPGCTIVIYAGERQPAYTETGFLSHLGDLYDEVADQYVEKMPSFKKLDINNGFGYYNIGRYAAMAGKPPTKGTAKVCGTVSIYRKNSPLIIASLYVDDPKDPALDLMVKAVCEMEVSFPVLPANQVFFDENNYIKLDVPENWGTMRANGTPLPDITQTYNLELMPPTGVKASFTLTTGKTKTGKPLTQKQFDALAQKLTGFIIPDSVEKKATFKEIQIQGGRGIYCIFTDASLVNKTVGPHQYKYAGQFLANYDNGCVTYATALADDPDGAEFQLMKRVFSSIIPSFSEATPSVQVTTTKQGVLISSAASPKKLLLPSKSMKSKKERLGGGTDNPGYFYYEDTKTDILISGWFEPAVKFQYSSVRQMWDSENEAKARNKISVPINKEYQHIGDWDVYLYDLPVPPQFKNTSNTHLRANYLDDKIWIDVHLSLTKDQPSKKLREMLIAYLGTLKITDAASGK